ncbi:MAG TPA: GNAT family N-acetyltransferase [Mycobacterium sp.]|nr:GNAT family N-acetyltransferase [Mycobacterium sp.]
MRDRVAPVEVRNYRRSDLAACRSLWVELTEWHRQIYGRPEIGGPDPGRKFDEHVERVGAQRIWLATIGGEVVGMVGVIQTEDEIELEPIVVGEQWRGRGIGRQLAERVVAEARAAGMGQLLARPVARNAAAIRFFHDLGFDALGQIELVLDFRPAPDQVWRLGATIADRDLRV